MRAAFFAARERPAVPLVRDAFLAAADRLAAVRLPAAFLACVDKARLPADFVPAFFSAFFVARDRVGDVFACDFALLVSRFAFFFVAAEAVFDGFTFTPARRAFDRPIAIA